MVTRATIPAALSRSIAPFGILDSGDSRVEHDWDMRGTSVPSGWVEGGTGHQYSATDGFNGGADGYLSFTGIDDTNTVPEGTLLFQVERAALVWDQATYSAASFFDAVGRTGATTDWLCRINESGGSAREMFIYRNGASGGLLTLAVESATNDGNTTLRAIDGNTHSGLDDRWAIVAVTWQAGRISMMIDGAIIASFTGDVIDGDIYKITLAGFLGDYWVRHIQMLNVCINPPVTGPRIALIGDSFVQRFTARDNAAAETAAAYNAVQNTLAYAYNSPGVAEAQRYTDRLAKDWAYKNAFTVLQSMAYVDYGIWPYTYNAGKSGIGWRSDLAAITSGQTDAVVSYDPEILWCFGSVNDINLGDTTEDIVTDIKALLTTMIEGCFNLRKVYFVETFYTPETVDTDNTASYYAEDARLRAKLATIDGYTVTNAAGVDIAVEFVETWSQWSDNGVVSARYGIGSHPDNSTSSANGSGDDGDVHPTNEGMLKIATILKPKFMSDLIDRPE